MAALFSPLDQLALYEGFFGTVPKTFSATDNEEEPGPPPPMFPVRATLPGCLTPSNNWHFEAADSSELSEVLTTCVTNTGLFTIKRIDVENSFAVSEIQLASNVPTFSPIFTYLHIDACPTPNGVVIGTVLPRGDLGTTTFYSTFLNDVGVVQGTLTRTLPGARANKQAFFCRDRGNLTQFIYHGSGENPAQTDTFVIEVSETGLPRVDEGLGDSMIVWTMTEDRETLWADNYPTQIGLPSGQNLIEVVYDGLEPVAEADGDMAGGDMAGGGANSKIRYGGIEVPIMFDTFETNDFRYWSSVQGN